jgi:nucleoside-diphosphate-sugar epimerase
MPDRAFFRGTDAGMDATLTVTRPFGHGDYPPDLRGGFCEQFCDFLAACEGGGEPRATAQTAARTAGLTDWAYARHERARVQVTGAPRFKKKVVVTGGTGFAGGHLIERLCEVGAREIVVPVRSHRSGANAGRFPVKMERTDLLDAEAVRAVMKDAGAVFHLAFGRDGEHAERVTVEGTRNVVEAAIAAGAESVVVVSTTAVFGDPGGTRPADETFPYAPRNAYEREKMKAERWTLARAAGEMGTRISVVNAACIYGPRGKAFTELPARLLEQGRLAWVEQGRGVANFVYAGNLADALMAAAESPHAHGERFIVSDGAMTWREFFRMLLGEQVEGLASYTRAELERLARAHAPRAREALYALARNPELWRVVRENPQLARVKTAAGRLMPRMYGRVQAARTPQAGEGDARASAPPPVWLAELYGATRTTLSAEKARRTLGWSPRMSFGEGMAASRAWLKEIQLLDRGA